MHVEYKAIERSKQFTPVEICFQAALTRFDSVQTPFESDQLLLLVLKQDQ